MCCLPSHALPVLCPSGLLSRSSSACQLTADGHVLTPTTFNRIIWWQLWPPEPQAATQSPRKTRGPLKSPHCSIAPETDGDFRSLSYRRIGKSSTGNVSYSGFYRPLCHFSATSVPRCCASKQKVHFKAVCCSPISVHWHGATFGCFGCHLSKKFR